MHSDRQGQRGGDIDVGVAILDGLGLLFFIIPGVIAYAVDFSNGTIYLPPSHRRAPDLAELRRVRFDAKAGAAELERVIENETGCAVKLDRPGVQVFEVMSVEEMMARFAEAQDGRLVSSR